ncbi:hypothetical protein [Cupriavidus necator]|uniref:hypothetical protein n=1 Tax=Cupriavidus necator TaxID=106590 RepID=UPI0013E064B8|nr:hypothetical protein [Cupriavidus necator]
MNVLRLISGLLLAVMAVAACSTDSGMNPSSGSSAQSQGRSSRGTGDGYRSGY